MKIVVLSDTHGRHKKVLLPEGDLLIHAGDITVEGRNSQVTDFLKWFGRQPHRHKIFIAGNHDFFFEQNTQADVMAKLPAGVHYLNDSGVTIEGIHIWGSPVTPWFYDWAFNRQPGPDIRKHWDKIPAGTDILVTHGPPYGVLDKTHTGKNAGCADLLEKVKELSPKFHLFGHIHEAYGRVKEATTEYVNASIPDEFYKMKNEPVIIEL